VSEALNHTLGQIRLRLERGLQLAEQELAETRDRCTRLELVIRSIRAQRSELVLLERPELARKLEPASDRAVVKIPEIAAGSDPIPEPAPEEGSADAEIPTSYMPMLEELWDIARHSDPE
jgi:hypothetical protein